MNNTLTFESRIGTLPRGERSKLEGLSPIDDHLWNRRMDQVACHVIVRDDDRPVGFSYGTIPVGIEMHHWERRVPNIIELGGVTVDPEYQRRGIMTEMMRLNLRMSLALGRTPVAITMSDNDRSIAYFESRGWSRRSAFEYDGTYRIPWVFDVAQHENK